MTRGDIFTEQLEGHFHWTATGHRCKLRRVRESQGTEGATLNSQRVAVSLIYCQRGDAGKDVHVRVRRVDNAEVTMIRTYAAHERISVKRASAKDGKR